MDALTPLNEARGRLKQEKELLWTEFTKSKIPRFDGYISEHKVSVIIDSGAMSNYMSKDLAIYLKLPMRETKPLSV